MKCDSCKRNKLGFCMLVATTRMAIQKPIGDEVVICSEFKKLKGKVK